jgi:hypothetical protein
MYWLRSDTMPPRTIASSRERRPDGFHPRVLAMPPEYQQQVCVYAICEGPESKAVDVPYLGFLFHA